MMSEWVASQCILLSVPVLVPVEERKAANWSEAEGKRNRANCRELLRSP